MYDGFWYIGMAMNYWIPMYFVCFFLLAREYTAWESEYIRGKLFEYIGIGWKPGIPMYFVLAIFGDTSEMTYVGPSRCIL